jgi:cytochrome P450
MEPGFDENLRESINALTLDKIGKDSLAFDKPATRHQLNVIRDVFNVVPIIWLADKFGIPLRSQEKPHGLMTVAQLHAIMVAFYVFITFDVMPTMSWRLHEAAERLAPPCRKILETRYNTTGFSATQKITDFLTKGSSYELSKSAHHFYSTMHKAKFPMDAAVDAILGIMLPTAATIAWQCSLLLDLFLSPGYEYAKDRLCELAKRQDEESWLEFTMWVYEGMRVHPHLPGVVRTVLRKTTMQDGDCTVSLNAADQVLLCKATACMDPIAFPNPQTLDPSRPMKSYLHLDIGMRSSFGAPAAAPAIVAMLRPVFQLRNLRRAKGTLGQLITVREQLNVIEGECHVNMYVDDLCNENIVPTSMVIEYDSP